METNNKRNPISLVAFGTTEFHAKVSAAVESIAATSIRNKISKNLFKFQDRLQALLLIPPTRHRIQAARYFAALDFEKTVAMLKDFNLAPEVWMYVLGFLRETRKGTDLKLVNSLRMLGYQEVIHKLSNKMIEKGGVPLRETDVLAVYPYGSRVYGTSLPTSDYDFIIITKDTTVDTIGLSNNIHATIYSLAEYQKQLESHDISCLECMSLPLEKMVKAVVHPQLESINLGKLRESISAKSSNSLVKAKKKLTLYDDKQNHYIGVKSMYHALRMIRFAIQIAKHGKIVDYGECNDLYREMMALTPSWDILLEKYKPVHSQWMTEFRLLAPKPEDNAAKR